MSPPASSTIVRTVLRVVPARRSAGGRILTLAALAGALASAGRRLWLARAARRFAAVRGPRFDGPGVARLDVATGAGPASWTSAPRVASEVVVDATVVEEGAAAPAPDDATLVEDATVVADPDPDATGSDDGGRP